MNSTPVNWEALDTLVVDFAKSENLFEDSSPPSSPSSSSLSPSPTSSPSSSSSSSSSYRSRILILQIRRFLEFGDVDSSLDLLRRHVPSVLDDRRLVFCLQKQKFIELLRRGTVEDRDSAINCLRNALAPCALDAYPEAYEEFKHVMLALIYDKHDVNSPVASEWSERRRFHIAGLMSSILRAHLHAHDPVFSMALRYLISIHKEFCLCQGIPSPISDLTERLLLEDKDPPATPQESLFEVPPFDEVDIQALAHAVQLTRQGAVDSLRFAKGDLFQAFQNEICRTRLNVPILDELVREYCVYRGIVEFDAVIPSSEIGMPPLSGDLKADKLYAGCQLRNDCPDADCGNSKSSDGESSISNTQADGSEVGTDMIQGRDSDVEIRFPSEDASNLDDCSTSGIHQTKSFRISERNRSHDIGEGRRRKRWRGRNGDLDLPSGVHFDGGSKPEMYNEIKCETVLAIKELAGRGMAAEVVEQVNVLDTEFFRENSFFLFQLKQVEFLKLADSGDYSSALKVACSHLGPLASKDPCLLKPLKETLLALLRPDEIVLKKDFPLHALGSSLQVALGRKLDIAEPQLMKVMQATLQTHNEWFKLQMCKDRFESFLKIDTLNEVHSLLSADTITRVNTDGCPTGSSQVTMSSSIRMPEDGSSPTQVSSQEVCDEGAILKVMEFLAISRADAIQLLAQHSGNAEAVIQQIIFA